MYSVPIHLVIILEILTGKFIWLNPKFITTWTFSQTTQGPLKYPPKLQYIMLFYINVCLDLPRHLPLSLLFFLISILDVPSMIAFLLPKIHAIGADWFSHFLFGWGMYVFHPHSWKISSLIKNSKLTFLSVHLQYHYTVF